MKISVKDKKYYINGKEVRDPLEFTIQERRFLKYFKQKLKEGLKITSIEIDYIPKSAV